jgi:energy-coupling factor transporter ATP-binding protein EcfA2
MSNPFNLTFGKKPMQFISRITQTNEVLESFRSGTASNQIYMISGVRGSGKTVLMTTISNILKQEESWIVIELNPTRDLLQSLAAKIYSLPEMHTLFLKAKLDFSAFGFGVSVENAAPVSDIETALGRMFEQIQKAGKRLLITIDEVTNSEQIRIFSSSFQIFLRQDYPIYLLMTGLYENIYDLQNDRSLTFLYRAPKLMIEPLNLTAVRAHYKDAFNLGDEQADRMAQLTKGYSFAFQVLGYLYWEQRSEKSLDDILPEYDQYLEEYVYSKIWSELSELDKKIMTEMSLTGETRVKNLRERLDMTSELFSVYRDRLKRKGVVSTAVYGHVSLILPRFEEFVKTRLL